MNRQSNPSSLRRAFLLAASLAPLTALLTGCNLFGNDTPAVAVIAKPEAINPELDAFLNNNQRQYTAFEELVRPGAPDSTLALGTFKVKHKDTTVLGVTYDFLDVSETYTNTAPAPTAFFARLGMRPNAIRYDTNLVPDPGASLPFPVVPVVGWRLDTLIGELRFVRVLTGTALIDQGGLRYETWAFAESTWWAGSAPQLAGTGTSWIGRYGLQKHQSQWTDFMRPGPTGTLRRTLTAN